jgi:hypothetical protein
MLVKTVSLIETVIKTVAVDYKDNFDFSKINVCESLIASEPMYFSEGSGFFKDIYNKQIEPDILDMSPCVVIPDMDKWVKTVTKDDVDYLKEVLDFKYLPRDVVVAFSLYHEFYHAMRFNGVDAMEFAVHMAKVRETARVSNRVKPAKSKMEFTRKNYEEADADDFAARMVKRHWDELFPDYVSIAAFAGTFPLSPAEIDSFLGPKTTVEEQEDIKEVQTDVQTYGEAFSEEDAQSLVALMRMERRNRERLRKENSLFNKLKRKVKATVDNFVKNDGMDMVVTAFLGGTVFGAICTAVYFALR